MIVPRSRLLFWVAAVVLPFTLLMAIEPGATAVSAGVVLLLFAAAMVDLFGARTALAGIRIELPDVTRMAKNREGRLDVLIQNDSRNPRRLRLALGLPPEIPAAAEEVDVVLPGETEWSRLPWPCTPARRGRYRIDAAYVEGVSPFGFWAARKTLRVQSEIRVYPNLLTERKNLAALFLNRGAFGSHAQRQVGKGRDFEKLREYVPGDSFDEIHWKATAKRGKPITKVFQIERTQEIYVIVDASRLSARAPGAELEAQNSQPETSILERFITAALVLGLAAEQQGDLFGVLTFADRVGTFVRAKNGQAHYNACRDALYTLQPQVVTPDYDELCTFIRTRLRRRALLLFLTSLDDPALAESFVRNMELLHRQHLVVVNMIRPPGVEPLFSRPDAAGADDLYNRLGGHLRWQKLRELEKVLQRRGVHFSLLQNERLSAELVSQYLGVKQRQSL
jgi:uncharacterized protein (DUF58 family)